MKLLKQIDQGIIHLARSRYFRWTIYGAVGFWAVTAYGQIRKGEISGSIVALFWTAVMISMAVDLRRGRRR